MCKKLCVKIERELEICKKSIEIRKNKILILIEKIKLKFLNIFFTKNLYLLSYKK